MLKFLEIYKKIYSENPIDDFFLCEFKNIVDCWLFKKINFKKFDFKEALNNCNLEENFQNFISKEIEKKKYSLDIIVPKNEKSDQNEQKSEKKNLEENKSNLNKLRLSNVNNISSYIGDKIELIKLKTLYIENTPLQDSKFFLKMQNLEKLTIKSFPTIQIDILEYLPSKLKKLYLEKNNFVNYDFGNILRGIFSNNKNILENLEYLSFAGNRLTKVDFCMLTQKTIFNGLLRMNFQKNNIYKIIMNPENFPNLKFVNCCKNNLNKSYLTQLKKIGSLESENGFLLEPKICEKYYANLKKKLKDNENDLYTTNYLNITCMPKIQTLKYFDDFYINQKIRIYLKKLDLSNNELDCNTFFKFVGINKEFPNLRSLNLNRNQLDDTFFEKFLENNIFPKLQHLYLNSNRIGDITVKIAYKDDVNIDIKYSTDNEKNLIYKLRLIYKFIQQNNHLNKLTITKNPISEFYSATQDKTKTADKSDVYIKRDGNKKIIINCLFSLLVKIRDELLNEETKKERNNFNLRFDCRSNVNKNSENYPYSDTPIVYKK